jgi:branched-chain amino acid transport system substrate-binding protein
MRKITWLAAAILILSVLAGCGGSKGTTTPSTSGGSTPAAAPKEPIKLGGIFDITGATGDVGTPHSEGVRAYIDFINSKGGVNGRQIDLKWDDYAYQTPKAVEIYKKETQQDKVVAVMGWGTGDTEAMKELIAKDKIPYISGSYSESLINPATTPYNFIVAATYSQSARVLLDYAKQKKAGAKVGMIFHDSAFGRSPLDDAKAYATKIGLTWAGEAALPGAAADAVSQVLELGNKGADFILIQNVTKGSAQVLKAAQQQGLLGKIQFLGMAYSVDENLIKAAGDASEGFVGTAPFAFPYEKGAGIDEALAYAKSKGKKPEDLNQKWLQGWTFGKIMIEAIRRSGDNVTGESIKKSLETIKDLDLGGLGAPLTFTDKSHAGALKAHVYEVKKGRWEPITDFIAPKE